MIRVSTLEAFRKWLHDEEAEGPFNPNIAETESMRAGTAFHKALEFAQPGRIDGLSANGYTFFIRCDAEIALPSIREVRGHKRYGNLNVTGQVDCLAGKRVEDHKTTAYPNLERFIEGYQWRFYLDIFDADVFRWNIFTIKEEEPMVYAVTDFNQLEQMRYPGLHNDCLRLATEFVDYMETVNGKR